MPTVPSVNQDDSLSLDEARALAGGGPEPASDGSLSLDEARKLVRGNLSTQLRATTSVNAERDPATVAEAQRLGAQYGLPTALAEQNLDALRQEETLRSADRLAQDSPRLAEWFIEDPDAAAIVRDSTQQLSTIEKIFQGYFNTVYRAPASGAVSGIGGAVSGLGEAASIPGRAVSRVGQSVLRFFSEDLADQYAENEQRALETIPWWMFSDQLLQAAGGKIKEFGQDIAVPEDQQNTLTDIGQGVGSFLPTAAAFALNPVVGLLATGSQGVDLQADRAKEAGTYGTTSADIGMALGAPVTAITERMGYGWLMKALPAPARNAFATRVGDIIKAGLGEGAQEVSEAVVQDAITKAMVDENFDMFQGLDREGLAAFGVGAIIRGVLHLGRAQADAGMATNEQRNMEEIARAVDSTGLRDQSPRVLMDALNRLKASGKTEVYVPVEQFQTLFQGENEADEARRAAGIDDAEYAAALTTNGKLRISTEGFFAGLDPKQRDALIPHARWTHEGMTPEEAMAFDPEKSMQEFMADLGLEARAADPSNRAFDYVRMALEQAGATPDVAETQAEMLAAQIRTLAYRSGVSVDDLMGPQGQERLTIRRAVDERVAQLMAKQNTDATVDSLIDAVRSGRLFTDTEINGQRMVTAIISYGGVRPDAFGAGDLKAQDAGKVRPGFFNKNGITLDQAIERLREDGYLPKAPDDAPDEIGINELNEMIIADLQGDGQYVIDGANLNRQAFNDAATVLAEELAALGIDRQKLAGMTNAQVRQALAATMKGEMLDQSVWHGSPHRGIEQTGFSLQKIGTGEGAQAYGWGLYFAGKKEIAEWYREQLSRRNEVDLWTDELRSQLPEPLTPAELNERGALGRKMLSGLNPQEMARWRELKDREDAYNEAVERLRPQGQLYAAEIPDDGDLLDWDAPLSEQPEKVRAALAPILAKMDERTREVLRAFGPEETEREIKQSRKTLTGQGIYDYLSREEGGERAASEALLAAGIPGLRYLDGTSRGAGDGSRNYVIWDEGAISDVRTFYQTTPQQAMETNVPVEMPADPLFAEAVANTQGASITADGLLIDLVRFQKPEQEGAQAIRTGVFYLPTGAATAKHYRNKGTAASGNQYGGTEKFQGETLIRRPLFVKGATGGKAPESAYDALKGKGAYQKMRADVLHFMGTSYLSQEDRINSIQEGLKRHGADPALAAEILRFSKGGNLLPYALQENIVAHAVRDAGYDAVVGYSKGKAGASISEVFDVREQTFPARGMDSQIHEKFYQSQPGQEDISDRPFYSALLRSVEDGKGAPRKGDSAAWKGWLDGAQRRGEFKQSERDWLGVDAWLDGKGTVTRDELVEFVRANEVQVEEVVLGRGGFTPAMREELARLSDIRRSQRTPEQQARIDQLQDLANNEDKKHSGTKFSDYRTPGGENYRELLLTLPDKTGTFKSAEERLAEMNAFKRRMLDKYGPNWLNKATPDELEQNRILSLSGADSAISANKAGYRSSHWDQPNVLAHIRFDERTDADGKRVLFIQEIQSDWHQEGRKKGYREEQEAELDRLVEQRDSMPEGPERDEVQRQINELGSSDPGVPNAPLKATDEWAMLAFKRAARWATENGFDRIAWATGEMNADIFGLSKTVDFISSRRRGDEILVRTSNVDIDRRIQASGNGRPYTSGGGGSLMTAAQIMEVFGSDIGKRIIDGATDEGTTLSGDGLKMGGEGMRGFYDKILPAAVNKWGKKFGAKVGTASVSADESPGETAYEVVLPNGKVVQTTSSKKRAEAVAKDFDGAVVRAVGEIMADVHAIDITPAMREAVLGGMTLFQEARGSLTIGPAGYPGGMRQFLMTLGQGADKSTFLHESAHFHLELLREVDAELRAADPATLTRDQKRLLADHDALLKWLGVDSFDAIERAHHEKYAETWEAYAREGRAPSARLQRVLYKFSTWLKLIYKTLKGLPNASLNDEVREIFDRMLATDDEIDAARQAQKHTSLFTDPADYGMTDEEWAQFREAERVARQSAIEAEQGEQYRYVLAEQARWKSAEMKALREEARALINASPIYRLAYLLRKGTQPDGSPLQGNLVPVKLNRKEMLDAYGKEWVGKNLRGMVHDDGKPAELIGQTFGFNTRQEVADALAKVLPMEDAVRLEADRLWHERNPNPMLDGGLEARVQQAVHNDAQASVMVREINALQAKSGKPGQPVVLQVMKNAAERIVGATRVRDLNANRHKATEAREGKEAIKAAAEGRLDDAVAARKRQLMAGLLYRETLKAQERAESHRAHAVKLTKKSAQERFAKAGWENYLDKINQILEAYEFKRLSNKALDRRQSLRAWVEAQQDAGEVTAVTPEILSMVEAGKVKNWREVTVGELDAVNDALRNIEHLASLKNKLMAGARQAEKDEAIAEMVARAEEALPETLDEDTPESRRALAERVSRRIGGGLASLNRPENVIEALDGGQSGPWHDFIWSALERGEAKMTELRKTMMVKLRELRDSVPANFLSGLNAKVNLFGEEITRAELVGMVLNTGNSGNLQRLMDGGIPRKGGKRMRLNAKQVQEMRAMLTAQELRYVQGLWNTVDALWPEVVSLTRRVGGVRPEKIQAQPFTVRSIDGTEITMEGGYWPAVYDSKRSTQGDQQLEGDAKQMLMAEGFVRAATPKGHTKQRAERVNATLKTDFAAVMSRHLDQVMTDLAYREAVRDIDGLLRSEKIKTAVIFRLGQDAYDNLKGALSYSVSASSLVAGHTATDWKWALDTVMANMSVSALAIRPDIALGNLTSATVQGLDRVGVRALMRGMHALMTQPQRTTEAITARSAFMAARLGETDFWYQQELNRIQGDRGFGPAYRRYMMTLHRWADAIVTRSLWWGHYQANLDKGEAEAIRLADKAIRQTQTASGRKDLSTFERDPQFTQTRQFMGPMFVIFGRFYAAAKGQGATRTVGERAATAAIQWFLAPAIFMLAAGRWAEDGDDDDDDVGLNEWALWMATTIGLFPLQTLPLVRDVGSAAESILTGKPVSPRAPPVTQATANMIRSGQSIARNVENYMDGDDIDWWDMTRDLTTAAAPFTGVPASQVKITTKTIQYWTDDPEEGRTELAAMAVYGPPKDYKPQ